MSTHLWIILDHVVALLGTGAWFAAGATLATRRSRPALLLLVAAVLVTLVRIGTVAVLAARGWWFVQEKVLLGLPLLAVTGAAAVLLAAPRLVAAARGHDRTAASGGPASDGPASGGPASGGPASGGPASGAALGGTAGVAAPGTTAGGAAHEPARGAVVALFTAGYAALAGLAVTFLAGYPLTPGTALLAMSMVCAAALLTARALAPTAGVGVPPVGAGATPTAGAAGTGVVAAPVRDAIPRRRFIGWAGGAVAVTAAGAGTGLSLLPAGPVSLGGGPARSSRATVSVADLRGADTPAPGGTVRRYLLTARKATVRLPSGRTIGAWTYNGQVPGPAITATEGDLIDVRLRNADIEDGVTLHWHGYDIACGEDGAPGVTQPTVRPGADFGYRFRADQVGTYWYHTHHASHLGVHKGLYGTLVVTPRDGQRVGGDHDLVLPVHTFDGTVVIGDRDGRTEHPAAPGAPVRLRLINTDSNPHRIALAGATFRVAAVDGRDLNRPGGVRDAALRLPAGGRYDLTFRMPEAPVALVVDDDRDGGLVLRPGGVGTPRIGSPADLPEIDLLRYGVPAGVALDPRRADRHFTMVLDRGVAMVDGRPAFAQTVNGRGHPGIPDQLVTAGDMVRFTVVNRGLETHPWHLHGHPVLILSRDGEAPTGSPLWVDTFDVRPGQRWEVAFRATNPGIWMNHCHNLPHAHQGMMLRLRYDGVTTPFDASHGHAPGHGH